MNIFLILLIATWHLTTAEECVFENMDSLADDCTTLITNPLVIDNGKDENYLSDKLKNIRMIRAGLVVDGTSLDSLDVLKGVTEISNDLGPAIIFRKNVNLRRIALPNLRKLRAQSHTLEFHDDNFPKVAYTDPDSLSDIASLKEWSLGDETCDPEFVKVIESLKAEEESNVIGHVFLGIALVVLFIDLALGLFVCKAKSQLKNGGGKGAEGKAMRKRQEERMKAARNKKSKE